MPNSRMCARAGDETRLNVEIVRRRNGKLANKVAAPMTIRLDD